MENLHLGVALTAAPSGEPAVWLVCLLGVLVVFVGLVAIIGILYLMNFLISAMENKGVKAKEEATPVAPVPVQSANAPIQNRQEIIAAVVAAVAEENGTDISAIRVISFKKL